MTSFTKMAGVLAGIGIMATGQAGSAQARELTLCWAAWDPANALVQLSKDFEAKTGVSVSARMRNSQEPTRGRRS